VSLLTRQWSTLPAVAELTRRDKLFEAFVLRHVDDLMSPTEGQLILTNATNRCPDVARRFCRELIAKARS
jgi:hypothetical protein